MSQIYQHDFAFGDTRGIREIMLKHAPFLSLGLMPWENFGYPAHDGNPLLKAEISKLIKNLTGKTYNHILVTVGAMHALSAAIAAIRTPQTKFLYTNKLYFGRYPGLAVNSGLKHIKTDQMNPGPGDIGIIDSPSNPKGELSPYGNNTNIIWDAAYYSPTYCGIGDRDNLKCYPVIPKHVAMAGSLNKLTGINGLRIGWLATDDQFLYEKALAYITSNILGVSQPSQWAALQILTKVNMNAFYAESKTLIDNNKTELQRLDYLFGYQEIPRKGMFALFEVDEKLKALLEKASVKVMSGKDCGDTRESVRFNLGNSNKDTKAMVDAILKVDGK
jgi:aspartate/methionine/tyrosine aminotransferase